MKTVNKYLLFNVIIVAVAFIIIFSTFIILSSPDATPVKLKKLSGRVTNYKYVEKNVLDDILPPSANNPPYFKLWLEGDLMFEAQGMLCERIDTKLFEILTVGDDISIVYNEKAWGQGVNTLYGIKYKDVTYLSVNNVNIRSDREIKTTRTVCWIIIGVTAAAAAGLYCVNYFFHNRKKKEEN